MEHRLYIGLGSNLGDRQALIEEAVQLIDERIGQVDRLSSFYDTEPWGFQSDNRFLNAAALVLTTLSPRQCLKEAQRIEHLMGRTEKTTDGNYEDRLIDIDLLMYDDVHIDTPDLTLPHPLIEQRDFVRLPLQEIMEEEE
ncbi:MAG: 2-amino-4-hydroxy-6-hydroxymethyldihydropteridine diphosphokinase [Bacteroidaceae bacterium]|nr:2-amino-4-hydroxy-6-hydroxymethyldihydropteridine diphosphokinase [Bacteroidaceae bacterium]